MKRGGRGREQVGGLQDWADVRVVAVCRVQAGPLGAHALWYGLVRAGGIGDWVGVERFHGVEVARPKARDEGREERPELGRGVGFRGDELRPLVGVEARQHGNVEVMALLPGQEGEIRDHRCGGVARVGEGVGAVDYGLEGPGHARHVLVPEDFRGFQDGGCWQGSQGREDV